ncbi:MAG TPA: hypothetical protein VLU94_03355 [Candidatus Nitrosotalea sp.]|nr:hypothetical protein [Candidatus Nitrosotalea sp.]
MKLPKEKRDRLILVIVLGLVAASSIWLGLIKSGSSRLERSRDRRAAAKDRVEKARSRINQAEKVETELDSALQALRAFEDDLAPAGADLYRWSYILMERARAGHDVEIPDVTRPQTNDIGVLPAFPYPAITFTVRGNADYREFGKFLADFENRFPYFRVQNITLGTMAEGGSDSATSHAGKYQLLFKLDVVAPIKPGS